ncbi:Detected protein of confused Function [Hibiscus syriacus]|uniref:RNA polymerase II transcription factor B subunit 2 n=1 Tax=Hibiscus syriacus TaxID=106335 RepID=A0A6A3BVG7_HIBSY|nr:Detected protein of confused Function [Hibiscus syriacus]
MPQVKITAKNFMDMVASLPSIKRHGLSSLPPLAKKYVLQMLYIEAPITSKSLQEWVLADGSSKQNVAIDRLIQLRVFERTNASKCYCKTSNLRGLDAYALEQWEDKLKDHQASALP